VGAGAAVLARAEGILFLLGLFPCSPCVGLLVAAATEDASGLGAGTGRTGEAAAAIEAEADSTVVPAVAASAGNESLEELLAEEEERLRAAGETGWIAGAAAASSGASEVGARPGAAAHGISKKSSNDGNGTGVAGADAPTTPEDPADLGAGTGRTGEAAAAGSTAEAAVASEGGSGRTTAVARAAAGSDFALKVLRGPVRMAVAAATGVTGAPATGAAGSDFALKVLRDPVRVAVASATGVTGAPETGAAGSDFALKVLRDPVRVAVAAATGVTSAGLLLRSSSPEFAAASTFNARRCIPINTKIFLYISRFTPFQNVLEVLDCIGVGSWAIDHQPKHCP
jgi:hypothetical protein